MKKIGGVTYIHYSAYEELNTVETELLHSAMDIDLVAYFAGDIIKIDAKNKKVSFIECENFDEEREPMVGTSYVVDVKMKTTKIIKPKGQIYHHKWMFVPEGYDGFDIEESKNWSKKWQEILPKDRTVKSRIGYKKYWNEYLEQYGLEVE